VVLKQEVNISILELSSKCIRNNEQLILFRGAQLIKSKVAPNATPSTISPQLAKTVHAAKVVSPYAVKCKYYCAGY
jgi:hypothetical protein